MSSIPALEPVEENVEENFDNNQSFDVAIENDSGLLGDFPEFENTDSEESSEDDIDDKDDLDYQPNFQLSDKESEEPDMPDVPDDDGYNNQGKAKNSPIKKKEKEPMLNDAWVNVTIKCSSNSKDKRVWDKPQYCVFCEQRKSKMARHLEDSHKNELEVAKVMSILVTQDDTPVLKKEKLKERKLIFERLRKRGNFNHNINVIKEKCGELVVEKSPRNMHSASTFLPCEFCYAFYYKHDLSRHIVNCKLKPANVEKNSNRIRSYASMLLYHEPTASPLLKVVFSHMLHDQTGMCVKYDPLIIKCRRHSNNGNQRNYISCKLRELGRMVLEARQVDNTIYKLADCLVPSKFKVVLSAVVKLCGFNDEENTIYCPSIGIKLGYSLKKASKIMKGEAITNGEDSKKVHCDDFCFLIENRWNDEISKCARTELATRTFNQPHLLPLTEDLQKLRKHLKVVISVAMNVLAVDNSNVNQWRNLATAVLTSMILFNRRRGGEPSLLEIEVFEKRKYGDSNMNEEVKKSLPFELKLCSTLQRVEIRGKRGRKVPLLLTKENEEAIKLLLHLRKNVGVHPDNIYVFSIPSKDSLNAIRGPDAMSKHVKLAELVLPEAICSTNLRKHVATLSQLLNLSESDLELLAGFLGYDIKIHREFYRLPEDVLQLAKCGKLLMIMEKGVADFAGKTLKDVEVLDDELVDEIEENEDELSDHDEDAETSCSDREESDGKEQPVGLKRKRKGGVFVKSKKTEQKAAKCEDVSDGAATDNDSSIDDDLKQKKKKVVRTKWTEEQKAAIKKHLDSYIKSGKAPGKQVIEEAQTKYSCLAKRPWKAIKDFVHNIHTAQSEAFGRKFSNALV